MEVETDLWRQVVRAARSLRGCFADQDQDQPTLRTVVDEMLTEKRDEGLTSCYLTGLRQYLALFSKFASDVPIASIGLSTIQDWFRSRVEAPSARARR
jgi:hypothetical protein